MSLPSLRPRGRITSGFPPRFCHLFTSVVLEESANHSEPVVSFKSVVVIGSSMLTGSLREPNDAVHPECERDERSPYDSFLVSGIIGEAYS